MRAYFTFVIFSPGASFIFFVLPKNFSKNEEFFPYFLPSTLFRGQKFIEKLGLIKSLLGLKAVKTSGGCPFGP